MLISEIKRNRLPAAGAPCQSFLVWQRAERRTVASLEICIEMTNKNHAVQRSQCLVIGECGWIWTLSFVSVLVVDFDPLAQFCTHAHRNLRLKVAWHIVRQLFWLLYLLLFFSFFRQQGQRQRGHRWVCPLIYYHFCRSTKVVFFFQQHHSANSKVILVGQGWLEWIMC